MTDNKLDGMKDAALEAAVTVFYQTLNMAPPISDRNKIKSAMGKAIRAYTDTLDQGSFANAWKRMKDGGVERRASWPRNAGLRIIGNSMEMVITSLDNGPVLIIPDVQLSNADLDATNWQPSKIVPKTCV